VHTKGARITVLAVLDLHSDWKTIAVTFGVLCLVCVLGVCAWCVCLSCLLRRACESGVVR